MKSEFLDVKTRYMAKKLAPWAEVILKVCGGYRAFESANDANTWKNQK